MLISLKVGAKTKVLDTSAEDKVIRHVRETDSSSYTPIKKIFSTYNASFCP